MNAPAPGAKPTPPDLHAYRPVAAQRASAREHEVAQPGEPRERLGPGA